MAATPCKSPVHSLALFCCSQIPIALDFKVCKQEEVCGRAFRSIKDIKNSGKTDRVADKMWALLQHQRQICNHEESHERNLGHSECTGQTQLNMSVKDSGDKIDPVDMCFTDTTVNFDHLIKTTSLLAQEGRTMESMNSQKKRAYCRGRNQSQQEILISMHGHK